ncbi:MAG: hypothetical protein AB7K24_00515 [Gemmataceae bacterium]
MNTTIIFLTLWLAVPLEEGKQPDITTSAWSHYTGNFTSPTMKLTINGPKEKTWLYRVSNDYSGTRRPPEVKETKGTYTLIGDLAVFTTEKNELRFGLNHGRINRQLFFNKLFPVPGQPDYRYHRKWYARQGEDWQPVEEVTLAIPAKAFEKGAESWQVPIKGECTRWQEGKAVTEKFDKTITFKKMGHFYYWDRPRSLAWLPAELYPMWTEDGLEAVDVTNGSIEDVHGFHPGLATTGR